MKKKTSKTNPYFILFLLSLVFFWQCESKTSPDTPSYSTSLSQYKDTSGPIGVITVVADTAVYNNILPFLIQDSILGTPLPASLIPQSLFGFRNFTPGFFQKRKTSRMVLVIQKGKPSFESKPSMYANGQAYIQVTGNTVADIKNQITTHQKEIFNEFDRANFDFLLSKMDNDHGEELEKLGVYMNIPKEYHLVLEKDNYQWYRLDKIQTLNAKNELTGGKVGTQDIENFNIQIEKFPLQKDSLSKEDFQGIINGYGLNRLKSEKEGNFLQIQRDFYYIEPGVESENYLLYDFEGMWEMKNENFGGSFLGRLILEKQSHSAYLALISINAPNPNNKRDNIIHAMSMIKSFKVLKPNS